ncbi:MAG: hypothetical protein ABIE42_10370 [Candidatus Eisenbacteria bacterium]
MRSKCVILQRAALMVAVLAMAVAYGGCSSVEPTDAWAEETGRVAGTVRSDAGALLPEIEVWLWTELGVEGREVCYQTETDQDGAYELSGVAMATQHSYQQTYWIGANRTDQRSTPIDSDYWTWYDTVVVPRGATCLSHLVIERVDDGPEDPEAYIIEN